VLRFVVFINENVPRRRSCPHILLGNLHRGRHQERLSLEGLRNYDGPTGRHHGHHWVFLHPDRGRLRHLQQLVVLGELCINVLFVLACCPDARRKTPENFICLTVFTLAEAASWLRSRNVREGGGDNGARHLRHSLRCSDSLRVAEED
jgi:hypothetical protein